MSNKPYIDRNGVKWGSDEEAKVNEWLLQAGLDGFKTQYLPIPGRKFRSDFAWVDERVLLEVQGLNINGIGGHNNIIQYANDCKRLLLLVALGWRVVYYCKGVNKGELLDGLRTILGRDKA